ncbi:peptide/nickel transport system ATP-binding protein [Angulomicrobium tetraedrale]|uniref:Peptide/nickel transport system ATP-binding protein n=1 Tax=Ancylobacter tetraedralis TaxID=217068 RepID=A0A839ZGH2_9HYPH|nr:ABC transporter ATP-binding protein [Ancylobacter tetraedralis]MBB3773768.1 peptide/nickel transport system ATP-binding protein [Ancylobacter tetraedralis]
MSPILSMRSLTVHTDSLDGSVPKQILHGVDFDLAPGEILGVIGESGSGKSTVGLAGLGYTRPGMHISGGSIRFRDTDLLGLRPEALRRLRGAEIAYVPQSAAAAFNPNLRIGDQVVEVQRVHRLADAGSARLAAMETYRELGLPQPETIGRRYPHAVSGGQLQRLAAAMAFAAGPKLVVFDEPTTALDVTTQIGVLRAFRDVLRAHRAAALYISHDLAVVAQLADRVMVMDKGSVVEIGPAEELLSSPRHPTTRALLDSAAGQQGSLASTGRVAEVRAPLLQIRRVSATYGSLLALRDVDLELGKGEIVAVVGESGSGKSTLSKVAAGLVRPLTGDIMLHGRRLAETIAGRSRDDLRRIQIVFQSADTALNPRQRVGDILKRPLDFYGIPTAGLPESRIAELLSLVSLPADLALRRSPELSGGQKQRLNLARALAAQPELVICDEVTSALDVVTRGEIVAMLRDLRDRCGTAFLFITHDLATAGSLADRIVVMKDGAIVEVGPSDSIMSQPTEPYTKRLLASVPAARRGWLDEALASMATV